MIFFCRRFRKRRLQVHRSKRDTFVDSNQNLEFHGNKRVVKENDVKDFEESTSSAIGCPSAKYFVHPRVAFSVRGNS